MKLFNEFEIETKLDSEINSLIMSQAIDNAEKLTELECKIGNIECYVIKMEGYVECTTYTEEAQDIFNILYDQQMEELYGLLNAQLKLIQEIKN